MCLWTSATGIIKLTRNWPTLASDSTLGDGNSLCLRSPRRALLHQCDAELDFGPICKRRSVWNCQRVGTTKVNNHIYMTNIKLIALIAGAAVLAGAPALILPGILRSSRPRRSRPDSMRKSGKIPNSKNSMTAFRRPHATPA